MALVFNAVPGTAGFNAYCTITEAEDYAATKLNTTFIDLPDGSKEALIIWATRQLDVLQWKGWKTDPAQDHEWPRTGVWRDGGSYNYGDDAIYSSLQFDTTTIPNFLKDATGELVLQLMESDVTAPSGTEGFSRIKVDTIELVMNATDRLSWFTSATKNLCWRYLRNSSKFNAPVTRVG